MAGNTLMFCSLGCVYVSLEDCELVCFPCMCVNENNKRSSVMTTLSFVMWVEKKSMFFFFIEASCWVWSSVIILKNV